MMILISITNINQSKFFSQKELDFADVPKKCTDMRFSEITFFCCFLKASNINFKLRLIDIW